ncbi:MAG: hypothetical protein ABS75_24060 [Pelagibacterium sp. SCN 63-23]|nr:MAG: hypothetical protein ABS75_24060 [Pelagibacterium sp. SCN 63-23]
MKTLDRLPPINNQSGQRTPLVRRLRSQITKPKKQAFPAVNAKKAAKVLEGLGKTVTGIQVHGDGSFAITASTNEVGATPMKNEWDEVLPHG